MHFPPDTDWSAPAYLAAGDGRQRLALSMLRASGVLEALADWRPVLTGTIPIGLAVEDSDLDLLCAAPPEDFDRLEAELATLVTDLAASDHHTYRSRFDGCRTSVTRFSWRGERFEVFAQPRRVSEQAAYRHMLVESRLLEMAGDELAERVRALKSRGVKTEPAFVEALAITCEDPYEALLELSRASDDRLRRVVGPAGADRGRAQRQQAQGDRPHFGQPSA